MSSQKIALVTGANSGMGKATVKALVEKGFFVVMLCRSKERGEEAFDELSKNFKNIALMLCDLGDMNDIRRFCGEFIKRYDHIDVLINNAGVITLNRQETKDGLELQFGVNHVGHFLLTTQLLGVIKNSRTARIVVVGSGAHKIGKIDFSNLPLKKGFSVFSAYGRAKLCNLLFTKELARRLLEEKITHVTVNCVHPGAVATNMGVDRKTGFGKTIMRILKPFFQTPEKGATCAIYVATSEEGGRISGEYWYKSKLQRSSKRSRDIELAKKLWIVSEELVKEKRETP